MANNRIQPQFIRFNGKQIAHVTGTTHDLKSNDERQVVLEGILGHSDGVTTFDTEVKTIVALVNSDAPTITRILLDKLDVEIEATLGAETFVVTSRCTSFTGSSEAANGKFEGTFNFEASGDVALV